MTDLDPTAVVAVIAVLGVLFTASCTLLGVLVTRGTETKKLIAGAPVGYASLVDDLQQERVELKANVKTLLDDLASVRMRIRGLEVEMDSERKRTVILLVHIGELRTALRRAGIAPPPLPEDSGVEDSGPLPAVTSTTTTSTTSTTTTP